MTVPVLTFFNNKGGVGKTSLIYHLAWMYADMGLSVVAADLDPQANLTGMFLNEDMLETMWSDEQSRETVYGSLQPLLEGTGDIGRPTLQQPATKLGLLAGDLRLSAAEDELSSQWPRALDEDQRAFRVLSALWRTLQNAAESTHAELVLVDVGPNLGALNRAALIATDYVVVPLGADLYSLQGLRNLGPALRGWRKGWADRLGRNPIANLTMPEGHMEPIGYVVQQYTIRLNRPVRAYDRWIRRIPNEYRKSILQSSEGTNTSSLDQDPHSLTTIRHYRSLVPMSQESRKPIFHLTTADGAFGSHAAAVNDARADFKALALEIMRRIESPLKSSL